MSIHTIKKGTLEYLAAEGISAPHAFTTRLGGVSRDHLFGLNLAMHKGDWPRIGQGQRRTPARRCRPKHRCCCRQLR